MKHLVSDRFVMIVRRYHVKNDAVKRRERPGFSTNKKIVVSILTNSIESSFWGGVEKESRHM